MLNYKILLLINILFEIDFPIKINLIEKTCNLIVNLQIGQSLP